jgi:hypothetical protein
MRNVQAGLSVWFATLVFFVAFCFTAFAAERFEDISIQPQIFFQGDTQHGYAEHRIVVENRSPDRTRNVTLELPDQAYHFGGAHALRSLRRTVAVGPNSTISVSLWQPPVPVYGNNLVTVYVDGRRRGTANMGTSFRHCAGYRGGSGGLHPGTFLVSRSLNSDDLDKLLKGESSTLASHSGPYSAQMAVGPPNAGRGGGNHPQAWSPEYRSGTSEWLELDFTSPRKAATLRIFTRGQPIQVGGIVLSDGPAELARFASTNMPPPAMLAGPQGSYWEFVLLTVTNSVRTVRIEFVAGSPASSLSVDAVEIHDGTAGSFAFAARASSSYASRSGGRSPSSSGEMSPVVIRAEIEASAWSEQWLAFTPFEAVLIMRADYAAMPPATQAALWNWVNAGGNLVVLGDIPVPAPWNRAPITRHEGTREFMVGFGHCVLLDKASTASLTSAQVRYLRELGRSSALPWQSTGDENAANAAFPVVENLQIPVRGLVALMLLFILVVGPLNIYLLSRMNKRVWMLWTIPAVSAVTCLLVFAWSLLSEGVTPIVRTEGFTLLDQVAHRATTLGTTAFYSPLTPGGGLRFGHETEATLLGQDRLHSHGRGGGGAPVEVDWTQSQHFARGWVTARVPAHFQLRKSETRRERLQLERSGGQLLAVNGLGANIQSLWLLDTNGVLFKAENIAAGQKIALNPGGPHAGEAAAAQALNELYRAGQWDASRPGVLATPEVMLRRGTYFATLAEQPFIEPALGKKAAARTKAIVYGVLAPEDVK